MAAEELAAWGALAAAFALLAAGVPLSSLALFALLGPLAERTSAPWWMAAAVTALATFTGHAATYGLFFLGGPRLTAAAARWLPGLTLLFGRLSGFLAGAQPWLTLASLRWVGVGYAQVFWLMGAMRQRHGGLWLLFTVNDAAWALVWTYGTVRLSVAAPGLARLQVAAAAALLLAGAAAAYIRMRRGA